MVFGFGKKKEKETSVIPPVEPPKDVPIDRILNMRQQMTDNQIIQILQREGYSSSQIFDAINQADLTSKTPESPYPPEQMEYPQQPVYEEPKEKIEELVEIIIDEKWNELVKDINKIIEWKDKIEKEIIDLNKKNQNLQMNLDCLKKSVLSKISQYDKGISGVGTSIKAMETAFSKVLPTFTENVNELNRITKKMKH